jgi:O-antigen ligase
MSIYYVQAVKVGRWTAIGTFLLAALGIFTSFGRGVFLALGAIVVPLWLRSKRKLVSLLVTLLLVGAAPLISPQMTDKYVATMSTIFSEGTKEGTGGDRATLWGWALREWKMDPIFGVGTGNFGIAVFKVVTPEEARKAGYAPGRLWGRSLHSAPMTVLSEYGSIGMLVWLGLLFDFLRTNRITRLRGANPQPGSPAAGFPPDYLKFVALGLQTVFIAIVVSCIFYEFIYTSLFWHVFVLNRLLYHAAGGPKTTVRRRIDIPDPAP